MRLLQVIDKSFLGKLIAKKQELIASTDPNRIYVENIRSFFNIPYKLAKFFCELAVLQGVFKKKIGVICFNQNCERIVLSIDKINEMPSIITCTTCQLREAEKWEFSSVKLNTIVFYQLVEKDGD